jgi:prepilin-type N-terminal cleavage/methylation domain-containing protein
MISINNYKTRTSAEIQGFTLIEILVAIAIFAVVATTAISSLLFLQANAKRAQATRSIVDNIGFAVEDLSRTAQGGTTYTCLNSDLVTTASCVLGANTPASAVSLVDSQGRTVKYYRDTIMVSGVLKGVIMKQIDSGTPLALSQPNVDVQQLSFYIDGTDRTIIIVKAQLGGKYQDTINIQTSVAQRSS